MSGQVTRKEAQAQQVQQQSAAQGARDVEEQEHHAKASASGGLNLNLFGALSGALSSKSKKTTHTNADGSSTSVEDRHDKGMLPCISTIGIPLLFKSPKRTLTDSQKRQQMA
jgi:hypothetical protein